MVRPINVPLRWNLQVTTPPNVIAGRISDAIVRHLNANLSKVVRPLTQQAKALIKQAMLNSREVQSLLSGDLREEFGLANPQSDVEQIINIVADSVQVKLSRATRRGGTVSAKLVLTAVSSNFQEVLASNAGSYNTSKGQQINWMNWLLTLGDRIIVREYEVVRGNFPFSRTGTAIMSKGKGRGWRVPPQYSGTVENNFITRATDSILPELGKTVERLVKQVL